MVEHLNDLMHEKEVYQRFGNLLADRELQEARRNHEISWFDLRKGPHYTEKDVIEYLMRRRKSSCAPSKPLFPVAESANSNASGNTTNIGSATKTAPTPSTSTGMTRRLVELAASRLEQET